MSDNLPAEVRDDVKKITLDQMRTLDEVRVDYRNRRDLPLNAYVRPGLGDLPLSTQLNNALELVSDLLVPLVKRFEAKQPEVVQCSVCGRNLGGWPLRILEDHYFQHTWFQRKLAGIGIR